MLLTDGRAVVHLAEPSASLTDDVPRLRRVVARDDGRIDGPLQPRCPWNDRINATNGYTVRHKVRHKYVTTRPTCIIA